MHRIVTVGLSLACALLTAGGQEPAAPEWFGKAIDNLAAQKGFHLRVDSEMRTAPGVDPVTGGWDGWVLNPDLSYFKMVGGKGTEVVNKGEQSAFREAGRTARWKLGKWAGDARRSNPMEYLRGFKEHAARAEFQPDEGIEGVPCRVVSARPPAETVKGLLEGVDISEEDIDWTRSTLTLRLWVGKDDQLLRQAVADLDATVIDPAGTKDRPPEKLLAKAVFKISRYNTDIGVERLAPEARELLQIQ